MFLFTEKHFLNFYNYFSIVLKNNMISVRLFKCSRYFSSNINKNYTARKTSENNQEKINFENVFSFPLIRYFALINRLKVYQSLGSCVIIPSCGIMEMLNVVPESTFYVASYMGLTGVAVLSLFTMPFRNIIGQLYISEDNKQIKISSLDYFGKRIDKIVKVEDWVPLLEIQPKITDSIYLRPKLTDGTQYKLFTRYGIVRNVIKMGEVLD